MFWIPAFAGMTEDNIAGMTLKGRAGMTRGFYDTHISQTD